MSDLLHLKRPVRLFALLMALCYFWLSAATSFQHTHRPGDDADETPAVSVTLAARQRVSGPSKSDRSAAKIRAARHCAACEWQAANVSPALPVLQWNFTPSAAPRAVTLMPRYLRLPVLAPSSRGPPCA